MSHYPSALRRIVAFKLLPLHLAKKFCVRIWALFGFGVIASFGRKLVGKVGEMVVNNIVILVSAYVRS